MKYLLDNNSLSDAAIQSAKSRSDLFILEETLAERTSVEQIRRKIQTSGINIVTLGKRHYERLKEVMGQHGGNLPLIRLLNCEGAADVLILAYVLSERDDKPSLFKNEWIIVTKDQALIDAASGYGFKTVPII